MYIYSYVYQYTYMIASLIEGLCHPLDLLCQCPFFSSSIPVLSTTSLFSSVFFLSTLVSSRFRFFLSSPYSLHKKSVKELTLNIFAIIVTKYCIPCSMKTHTGCYTMNVLKLYIRLISCVQHNNARTEVSHFQDLTNCSSPLVPHGVKTSFFSW